MNYAQLEDSWKKRARNMMHETRGRGLERRKMVAKKTKGHSGADHLREEEG